MIGEVPAEQVEGLMSTSQALQGMVLGLGGIGLSWYLVGQRLRPAWRPSREQIPALPWNVLHLPLLFLIYLLSGQAVGLILHSIYGEAARGSLGAMPILVSTLCVNGLLAAGIWTLGVNLGVGAQAYGLAERPHRVLFLRGALMFVASMPAIFGASLAWGGLLHLIGVPIEPQAVMELVRQAALHERWAVFLMAALFVPLVEEFLFRGFLQTWLVKTQGAVPGILITSVLFAMLHGTTAFGGLLAFSIAAGWIRHRSGSLWPAVAVHICNNAVTSIWLFVGTSPPGS